jgi:hypothetical protein
MGKHNSFQKAKDLPRSEIHPVWRGIGCIIILLTPIISWAAMLVLLDLGKSQKWSFVYSLSGTVHFPAVFYTTPIVKIAAYYLSSIPYLEAMVLFFILFLILFSGVFAFINAVLYRMIGPPRYTRLDEPAPRVKTKRYTR